MKSAGSKRYSFRAGARKTVGKRRRLKTSLSRFGRQRSTLLDCWTRSRHRRRGSSCREDVSRYALSGA